MALLANDFFRKFVEAGVVPEECTHMVIDVPMEDIVRVYWCTYAQEKLVGIVTPENLKDALVVKVGE